MTEQAQPPRRRRRRLTEIAHDLLRPRIMAGDVAIDATAGNGHDTAFLLERVQQSGLVYAFDVQQRALEATAARARQVSGGGRLVLLQASHAEMAARVPQELHGTVKAVMFNLGYLPSGDHHLVTTAQGTLAALNGARGLLVAGGVISILAYPGHPGGAEEAAAVGAWVAASGLSLDVYEPGQGTGPCLWLIVR